MDLQKNDRWLRLILSRQFLAGSLALGMLLLGMLLFAEVSIAAEPEGIRFARQGDELFLNAADVAGALGFEFKVVDPGRLVTFCREQEGGVCIPFALAKGNHQRKGEQLLIAAKSASQALRFQLAEADGRVTIVARTGSPDEETAMAAQGLNAPWGDGRGFSKGQTLPDIPLVDVAGNEVRFSQFLGKRYILYCWASW